MGILVHFDTVLYSSQIQEMAMQLRCVTWLRSKGFIIQRRLFYNCEY